MVVLKRSFLWSLEALKVQELDKATELAGCGGGVGDGGKSR